MTDSAMAVKVDNSEGEFRPRKPKITVGRVILYILLIIGAIIMVVPFYWGIKTSTETLGQSVQVPPNFGLSNHWSNYTDVLEMLPFGSFFMNTIVMCVVRVITCVLFSAMAGYAIARIKFPGVNAIFFLILIPMMIPGQIYTLPQYLMLSNMGMANTIFGLILPGVASTFGTFLMRQFFMGVPMELEEAAELDGASPWKIFTKIMFPLARAPMVSLGIFTALWSWKDLMWPLIINTDADKLTLTAGLALLQGQHVTNYPEMMAGSLISIVPMIILYMIFQKQFVQGIVTTGGK
jgi:multiple sugar transport system permease protein